MKYILIIIMITINCIAFAQVDTVKYLTNTFSKTPSKFINKSFCYFDSTLKVKINNVYAVGCFNFLTIDSTTSSDSFSVKVLAVYFESFRDFVDYKKKKKTPEIKLTFKQAIKLSRQELQYLIFDYSQQAKGLLKNAIISKLEVR